MKKSIQIIAAGVVVLGISSLGTVQAQEKYVAKAGDISLHEWLLPNHTPYPKGNKPTAARVALGKMLYFDKRLSGNGTISCASCHSPQKGWSDGLPFGRGIHGSTLPRSSPTVINSGFNTIQMWDGRKASLEDQAIGPMEASKEMGTKDIAKMLKWLSHDPGYKKAFHKAYPGEKINRDTLTKAIASFERTLISNNSPFDRWVKGDKHAMNKSQIRGFKLFVGKAHCAACHSAPNFTDNGFHNLGLASFGNKDPDMGRYKQVPLRSMKGAFKTPTLRDVARTAPYFHDGSAKNLMEVVEHYNEGGVVKTNLSPDIKPLHLSKREEIDLVNFMKALSSPPIRMKAPKLPK